MKEPTDIAVLPPTSAHFSKTTTEALDVAAEIAAPIAASADDQDVGNGVHDVLPGVVARSRLVALWAAMRPNTAPFPRELPVM